MALPKPCLNASNRPGNMYACIRCVRMCTTCAHMRYQRMYAPMCRHGTGLPSSPCKVSNSLVVFWPVSLSDHMAPARARWHRDIVDIRMQRLCASCIGVIWARMNHLCTPSCIGVIWARMNHLCTPSCIGVIWARMNHLCTPCLLQWWRVKRSVLCMRATLASNDSSLQ
jgi:hypothetical protein